MQQRDGKYGVDYPSFLGSKERWGLSNSRTVDQFAAGGEGEISGSVFFFSGRFDLFVV